MGNETVYGWCCCIPTSSSSSRSSRSSKKSSRSSIKLSSSSKRLSISSGKSSTPSIIGYSVSSHRSSRSSRGSSSLGTGDCADHIATWWWDDIYKIWHLYPYGENTCKYGTCPDPNHPWCIEGDGPTTPGNYNLELREYPCNCW